MTALSDKIDTTRMKKPSFLMVLTANGLYAYQRDDGVHVVPISCLKDLYEATVNYLYISINNLINVLIFQL